VLQDLIGAGTSDAQYVNATLSGGSGTYYFRFQVDHPERFVYANADVATSSTVVISLQARRDSPGRSTGTANFDVCSDAYCAKVVATRSFSYRIATFRVAALSVALSAPQGGAATPQTFAIEPADTEGEIAIAVQQHVPASPAWLSAAPQAAGTPSTSDVVVDGSANGLDLGSYSGWVNVSIAGKPAITKGVTVSMTVGSAMVPPAPPQFAMTVSSTTASLARTVPVTFQPGVSPAWTAEVDQPWLTLQGASGTGTGSVVVGIDPAALATLPNWTTSTGHLTIHPAGLVDLVVPVTLDLQLPALTGVSPPVIGLTGYTTLTMTGRGLSQPGALGRITIEGGNIVSRTAGTDTSATVRITALPAGRHGVMVTNLAGLAAGGTAVHAVDATAQPYAFIAEAGGKRASLFDGARNAVFTTGYQHDFLTRFMKVDGLWHVDRLAVAQIGNVAMSFDHATLYVTSGTYKVSFVDPDTLTVRQTVYAPFPVTETYSRTSALPSTADGRVWLNQIGNYYDSSTQAFGPAGAGSFQGVLGAPSDGTRVFFSDGSTGGGRPYTTATGAFAPDSLMPAFWTLNVSADSSRRIADWGSLYDGDWALLGRLAEPNDTFYPFEPITGDQGIPSPDGSRAYALVNTSRYGYTYHIGVFDTTQYRPGTTDLLEIGQIALPDQAQCTATPNSGGSCDTVGTLLIDPAGTTLYWSGHQGLVVLPIPASLRQTGPVTALRALKKASVR
jgi:hypothetical protein